MKVEHYRLKGRLFREITERSYKALQELQRIYGKYGHQTWLNSFDGKRGIWVLTVKL